MIEPQPRVVPWLFDDFEPGAELGAVQVPLDARRAAQWAQIYGGETPGADRPAPRGLLVAGMMEAYIRALQPRPPGNVHAGQQVRFSGPPPRMGASLTARFFCKSKAMKNGRRWLTLGVDMTAADTPVLTGEILTIWAA